MLLLLLPLVAMVIGGASVAVIVVVKDGVLRMIFEVVGAKMASRGQKNGLRVKSDFVR